MNKFSHYRPEIDGLRALAVIAVILYHAEISLFNFKLLTGGFLGVDVFFVISGYLITKIILNEIKITGKFSFINFYKRRARRILPALFFIMLCSFPFAYNFLIPNFFIDYSKSIISSLGFVSNFYFWSMGFGYDQLQTVRLKPFLHTWSLSVEEQYYIIFPLIILIIFKYLRKYLIHILILGFVISLGLADWGSRNHPSFNFYVLPTRGWELLAGSILASVEIKYGRIGSNVFLIQIFPILGALLIIHSLFYYNDEMFLPSFYTLPSIIGVCLILWFCHQSSFVTKFFSNKYIVGIGLISYSLYLWHLPIFVLFSNINITYLIVITFLLSIFSYFFIEKPFRRKFFESKFYNIKTLIISAFIILLLNCVVVYKNGFYENNRYPDMINKIIAKQIFVKSPAKVTNTKTDYPEKNNIYIAGDSHMYQLTNMLNINPKISEYNFYEFNSSGCYYIYDFDKIQKYTLKVQDYCSKETQAKRRKEFLSKENSILVMGGRLPVYLSGENYDNGEGGREQKEWWTFANSKNLTIAEGVRDSIIDLLNNDLKIILVYPIPPTGFNVPKKILDVYLWNKDAFEITLKNNPITTSYKNFMKYAKESFAILDNIEHPNLYKIFPHKIFCNTEVKDRCITHDDENILYVDNNHLSPLGMKIIEDLVIEKIYKIEKNKF